MIKTSLPSKPVFVPPSVSVTLFAISDVLCRISMLYKAKLVYSLIIFGPDDDVKIINEESLKNEDNLKNEDDLKMKATLEMKTT